MGRCGFRVGCALVAVALVSAGVLAVPGEAAGSAAAPRLGGDAAGSLRAAWGVGSSVAVDDRAPRDGERLSRRHGNGAERGSLYLSRGGGGGPSVATSDLARGVSYEAALRARYRSSADGATTGGFVRQASTDATLSALSVNSVGVHGFAATRAFYQVGVAAAVATATVAATATDAGASVGYSGTDADGVAAGHQVDLSAGVNRVTVTVTAQDTTTTKTYSVLVNRGVTAEYGWRAVEDLDGLSARGTDQPRGVWSDGTTMWVANDGTDAELHAFKVSDKTRDSSKDFDTLSGATNDSPAGIWSDETTMWVADWGDDKLYAYKMSDKTRDSSKDFDTLDGATNNRPNGIWSDGITMWVADTGDDKLYAYDMSTKAHESSKDIDLTTGNDRARGIWSDGITMWVADAATVATDVRLYAYKMSTKAYDSSKNFGTLAGLGIEGPTGLWSDGTTMWVTDTPNVKLYSFNLPVYPVSASVDGAALAVTFSQDMSTAAPASSAFTVKKTASGTESTVALTGSPAVSGKTVTLTVSTALAATDTAVKVSYAKPASGNKLANSGGNEVSAFTDLAVANSTGATVPGAPTGLSATARGPARIDLAWTAPASDGGASVAGYKVEVSVDGGSSFADLVADTASTATSYSDTGLSANSTRHYRVSAVNSVGAGAASDSAFDVTNVFVRNLAQGDHEDDDAAGGLSQRFTTGANVGGYILASVEIVSGDADGDDFTADVFAVDTASGHPTGSGTRLVAPGSFAAGTLTFTAPADTRLDAGTTYALVVEAIGSESVVYERTTSTAEDSGGASGWGIENTYEWKDTGGTWRDDTDSRSLRIALRGVNRTATAPDAPTGLTATASGTTQIDLSWTAPADDGGAAISGYRIEASADGGANFTELVATQTGTAYSHAGLTAGATRHYRVSAINSVGTGAVSAVVSATTAAAAPGAPTALAATASGTSRIDLSWTAPVSDGGASISGYKIETSADGGSTFTILAADTASAATSYAHTGLTANSTRHYRVSAINSAGTGAASNTASATTPTAATVPGQPTGLAAAASGTSRIDLSWTAPVSDGGASISGYKIETSADGGSTFTILAADTASAATSYAHTGLTANTTLHYRVSAINSVGAGAVSNTASATTATAVTVPGAPTGLTATARGPARIDLAWTAPTSTGGAAISGYKVETSANGTTFTALAADTGSAAVAYSHTGLAANTTRHYRVSAINSVGTGPVSAAASDVTNVFVRNTGQGGHENDDTVRGLSQRFTTGANVGGYTLAGVEIVSADGEGDDFTAEIWTVDTTTGHPSARHAALAPPGDFAAGTLRFAAPAGTTLDAGTTYALVVETIGSDSVAFVRTVSTAQDAGAAAGWGIEDTYEWKDASDTWHDHTDPRSLRIALRGTPKTQNTTGGGGGTVGGGAAVGGGGAAVSGAARSGGGGGGLDAGVATFVVANGWSPPDIGAASVLAARTADAVVAYTADDELSRATAELLREARPAKIIIVGGLAAVPSDVRTQIRSASPDSRLERIDGADRAHTAAAVARRVLGSPPDAGRVTVIVANGSSPPDIGAAAALAARSGRSAVLYTQRDSLPEPSAALLRDYQTHRVILIGGTAAISDETQAAVAAAAGDDASVTRLTGIDRVDTAAQAARRVLGNPAAAPRDITLVIANGWSPPDIGVAAALAAATPNAAVAYTEHTTLPQATRALIADYRPRSIIIVGGRSAVADDVRTALTEAAPDGAAIRRISGDTRTDTAARAARRTLAGP